jgi:YD repeat-containing protein
MSPTQVTVRAPDGSTTTYHLTKTGHVASLDLPDGTTYTYTRDGVGRVVNVTGPQVDHTIVYDGIGSVTSMVDNKQHKTTTFSYDAFGNRISESDGVNTTSYTYNDVDALTSITKPDGTVVNYSTPIPRVEGAASLDKIIKLYNIHRYMELFAMIKGLTSAQIVGRGYDMPFLRPDRGVDLDKILNDQTEYVEFPDPLDQLFRLYRKLSFK